MSRATSTESEWATFGRDLLLSIAGVPRGRWTSHLSDELRDAIRSGALKPGVRLPSSRTLAGDLGLSRGVALAVYEQLKAEGYLSTRRGSGTIVARLPAAPPHGAAGSPGRPSFRSPVNPGLPDAQLFPRQDWVRAYRTALKSLPDSDLSYGDPQGYEPLRAELADYLGRVRGLRTTGESILVVNGFAQGLAILARLLLRRGTSAIAVEDPGSTGTRGQLNDWGMATPPVVVDGSGLCVTDLEATAASAVLLTPAHQYPTGVVLAPERRQQLIAWAHDAPGRYIIEDDYDAEFRYDTTPVGSLQPLAPERVVTGSSVSKTLSPALRLGWLVLPSELLSDAVSLKATFDLGTSVLPQAAFVELLRAGAFDRHVRRSRIRYRQKRGQIAERLAAGLPGHSITGLDAGLNICIHLEAADDQALAEHLREHGVACQGLSHYQQGPTVQPGIVFDVATTTESAVDAIVLAIRAIEPRRR